MSEECPAGGEHCAHWFDGEPCCFCELDGPTHLDDWSAIAQANPGLGHTVSEAAIRSALDGLL